MCILEAILQCQMFQQKSEGRSEVRREISNLRGICRQR
jgi:hypothetical protein